jgi:hypothetical protein
MLSGAQKVHEGPGLLLDLSGLFLSEDQQHAIPRKRNYFFPSVQFLCSTSGRYITYCAQIECPFAVMGPYLA